MDEFVTRQHSQMRFKIGDFRQGALDLNGLIQQLEGLARAVGESFWVDHVFPLVLELETVNSEIIDKQRTMTPGERENVEAVLKNVEALINLQPLRPTAQLAILDPNGNDDGEECKRGSPPNSHSA